MKKSIQKGFQTWISPILGSIIAGLGLMAWTGAASAAEIVCRGTMSDDADFAAFYGENGFVRIKLKYAEGGTVEIPLRYARKNGRGESIFQGKNPNQPSDVVKVFAPTQVQAGTTIRVNYQGDVFSGNCSNSNSYPSNLTEGSFLGKGQARDSVFGDVKQADASLDFNSGNFSLGLYVPPGTGAQVRYQGTINSLRGTDPNNPYSFILRGQVNGFASSANGLQMLDTTGTCEIEVFDSRIVSTLCETNISDSKTRFVGLRQF
jgi:hypothetical protein